MCTREVNEKAGVQLIRLTALPYNYSRQDLADLPLDTPLPSTVYQGLGPEFMMSLDAYSVFKAPP